MFPTVKPLAPWEGTALLSNTALAAGLENTAKLDRLTFLEALVANLLLGQPATLGLAALPAVRRAEVTPDTRPGDVAHPGDFTGAHCVVLTYHDDDTDGGEDAGPDDVSGTLQTRSAADMIAEIPHVVPGDAWLVLVTNAATWPLTLRPGHRVTLGAEIAPGAAQLFLVTVVSLNAVTFIPLLAGTSLPAVATV